jgi:hypothetical protein
MKQLRALERRASAAVLLQADLLDRQRKILAEVICAMESLRQFKPGGDGETASIPFNGGGALRRAPLAATGPCRLELSPTLTALADALMPGGWKSAASLTDSVFRATQRRPGSHALIQAIYRLKRQLNAAGSKFRIVYKRPHGWRFVSTAPRGGDT